MASPHPLSASTPGESEELHRQAEEMHRFATAAMARPSFGSVVLETPTTTDATTTNPFHPSSTEQSISSNPSLEAAAAALTEPRRFRAPPVATHTRHHSQHSGNAACGTIHTPLFAEQVVMPRPLFFGSIVPPRVLHQARAMIATAVAEHQEEQNHSHPPLLQDLPDAVRNVVGALRTFGYGLDKYVYDAAAASSSGVQPSILMKGSSTSSTGSGTSPTTKWRGHGTVATFQPVWGTQLREQRYQAHLQRRPTGLAKPPTVSRVATAPAALSPVYRTHARDDDDAPESRYQYDVTDDDDDDPEEEGVVAELVELVESHSSVPPLPEPDPNQLFSAWLRSGQVSSPVTTTPRPEAPRNSAILPPLETNDAAFDSKPAQATTSPAVLDQNLFAQWVQAGNAMERKEHRPINTWKDDTSSSQTTVTRPLTDDAYDGSTFQKLPPPTTLSNDSDDDSLIDDEQNTQVGANDNLSKAVAMFSDGNVHSSSFLNDIPILEHATHGLLSPVDGSRQRPLTNYELTGGYTPLFGVDDTPLPQLSDLGKYETEEDQQRALEQKRSQDIIEKCVPPNVFGALACPNPALHPDDYHSWNSRAVAPLRHPGGVSVASDSKRKSAPKPTRSRSNTKNSKELQGELQGEKVNATTVRDRYGWWNEPPEEDDDVDAPASASPANRAPSDEANLQLPPIYHSSSKMHVYTPLEPSMQKLKEDNLPLSRMHAASSMAQSLPYLSDRPHSHRYLQIDTKHIAFPPLKGEIEPLFCSLAIYNVETISSSSVSSSLGHMAPIPDWQRCGRVTEALQFDHVTDPDMEERCAAALTPYFKCKLLSEEMCYDESAEKLRGTSCGVFPLPSNLNVANLYAVLIVRKVLSEEVDLEPYLKPRKAGVDLEKLKATAERASNRNGAFLIPFAFGVAPLLQVFGSDNPVVASSRAVQIPLFHFSDGERQIIDHIMVMLFPRADHKSNGVGGPAPVTNGGTAMLVMRNFGYLGLHTVVNNKSSLARHRLVDFTGELQIRRRTNEEQEERRDKRRDADNYRLKLPPWHPLYMAEPVYNGGRTLNQVISGDADAAALESSSLYAQELAPLPLLLAPASILSTGPQVGIASVRSTHEDIEPFYHTTFCNELICHPRILHNCEQGHHYSVKVELREIEWNETVNGYLAHLPRPGVIPCIHNPRRGPFLVQSAFTSCTSTAGDHHFIDEFKVKLPLDLNPKGSDGKSMSLALFFTVYRIRTGNKGKWKRGAKMLFGTTILDSLRSGDDSDSSGRVKALACGFLPIAPKSSLIDDGIHDIRVAYTAKSPPSDLTKQGIVPSSSLLLEEKDLGKTGAYASRDSSADDTAASVDSRISDYRQKDVDSTMYTDDSSSDFQSIDETRNTKPSSRQEHIALSVRVVAYSSLHSQNVAVTELLHQEHDAPLLSYESNKVFLASLRMGREFLCNNAMDSLSSRISRVREDKLLESSIAIADSRHCPMSFPTSHLLRIIPLLWRSVVFGDGEPDLVWADPCMSVPLRVHAFATLLHLVGATSLYLAKNGVTQVDGRSKFSFVVLGRVLALMFDEHRLFGHQAIEKFDLEHWCMLEAQNQGGLNISSKKSPPRVRHVRQTYELGHDAGSLSTQNSGISSFLSTAGDLATLPKSVNKQGRPIEIEFGNAESSKDISALKSEVKVDSKRDFQSLMRLSAASDEDDNISLNAESEPLGKDFGMERPTKALLQAYGGISGVGGRRYMTMPSPLSTILEGADDLPSFSERHDSSVSANLNFRENVNRERFSSRSGAVAKQMRRPRVVKGSYFDDKMSNPDSIEGIIDNPPRVSEGGTATDDDLTSMGDAYLDRISEMNGLTTSNSSNVLTGEGMQVKARTAHRRQKTKSASAIDWNEDSAEKVLRNQPRVNDFLKSSVSIAEGKSEHVSTLTKEESYALKLPNFADRLTIIGKMSSESSRWFPYTYEVIIMQWAAFLVEQRKSGEKTNLDRATGSSYDVNESLNHAAMRAIGVAVAGAPMLFEVIKQSLGFRVKCLFDTVLSKRDLRTTPPLVSLDDALMLNLVQVVSMLTDACIDSRNFDSWELRQMSIDVNDSIVRFLRDLFSFLSPSCVHQLVLAYLSRFLTKDGKHFADRDSLIGLRCSWEITKLRLNAVTAFVRYPDFIKVNGPQMLSWERWWTGLPPNPSNDFFDDIVARYARYNLPQYVSIDESAQNDAQDASKLQPHWLAEILIDICLFGTEHAEQYIQHRAASLLHELLWSSSQESILFGISAPVASMFITLVEKVAAMASYISNFSPKSQLRKDMLSSVIFVLQSAPPSLLRALWRRFILRLPRRLMDNIYFSSKDFKQAGAHESSRGNDTEVKAEPNILAMFSVLNLSLRTLEYEGSDENIEGESSGESRENMELWRKEYLLSRIVEKRSDKDHTMDDSDYSTTVSRRWHSHDGSMVAVNTGHHIVLEMHSVLTKSNNKRIVYPMGRNQWNTPFGVDGNSAFSLSDTMLFVRGVTSLYLQALALRESDIVVAKALEFSSKVIDLFGIKIFIEAVGETLQHWMRVISLHCGARRALVRIEATDLLELLLRSTWDCFGSFFRIRVPLLAVQTEVMERIVAVATARYYRDQRRFGTSFEVFTNLGAEASLVPLWRSLDRIQKKPASQQIAYKRALIRIAGKLKILYKAYVAARVLSFMKTSKEKSQEDVHVDSENADFNPDSRVRALQISILRVINASDGYSKLFLGLNGTTQQSNSIAHYEAIEDALIVVANVFSPTELPEHRVAWLRLLAEFHHSRKKYAEEASCHYRIHVTLHLAAKLHRSLWSNTAFLPWTDNNTPNPIVYIDSDAGPAADPDCSSVANLDDWEIGGHPDSSNSFRRIFYRVANSIGFGNNEWETGESKTLFNGITFASEYDTISPWMTLREMEEHMVEEVEAAGALFLRSGIVDSSRFAWNLATQYYAEKYNYAKLAIAYANLARVVVSQVPSIDTSVPQEMTTTLGRFYRVWFHGGAPDDLNGVEFVYRSSLRLKEFGEELRTVIMSIVPSKTPINLVADGLFDESSEEASANLTGYRLGQGPLEPVRIKVTPLRPLFDRYSRTRGMPEWFHHYTDEMFSGPRNASLKLDPSHQDFSKRVDTSLNGVGDSYDPHNTHNHSFSATLFSSVGNSVAASHSSTLHHPAEMERTSRLPVPHEGDLAGVDRFCFVQPKNRARPMEWWKAGDFTEKSLRVTQLQVAETFPACISRQVVAHRLVYSQSPLEAGIDTICQWCAILFQTAVATTGMAVLKTNYDPGIGTDAAKVVADCIHNSRVKEIGLALLKEPSEQYERNSDDFSVMDSGRLSEDEVSKLQLKLARLVVAFIELLHLLIGRNRDMLLEVIQERKKNDATGPTHGSMSRGVNRPVSVQREGIRKTGSLGPYSTNDPTVQPPPALHRRNFTDMSVKSEDARGRSIHPIPVGSDDNQSYQSMMTSTGVRTESAIAVQSELQRAFISLTKALYKNVQGILQEETPRWFKQIGQDNYFSLGTYLQTKIPIAEELCFMGLDVLQSDAGSHHPFTYVPSFHSEQGYDSPRGGSIAGLSQTGSVVSKGSERYGFGQF